MQSITRCSPQDPDVQGGSKHGGPILSPTAAVTQLIPVVRTGRRVELGAHGAMKQGEGALLLRNPDSHVSCTAPGNGKQKESNRKTSRQHLGLKNLFQAKNCPTKSGTKRTIRDKSGYYKSVHRLYIYIYKKSSEQSLASRARPQHGGEGTLGFGCARGREQPHGQDCLSEGMQRSSAPKLRSGHAGASRVSPRHARSNGLCYTTRLTSSHTGEHRLLLCPNRAGATNPSMGAGSSPS